MNIKIITRHSPSNYGSLLQSIATIKAVEYIGHQCEIIDYQRPDEQGLKGVLTQLKQKNDYNNPIKKLIYIIIRYPIEKFAQMKFDKMRNKYLKMTARCSNQKDLKQLSADVFVTGSDQVWGPMMNGIYDDAYFLKFANKEKRKVAYAASFGKTKFEDAVISEYHDLLDKYDKIAVREYSAVALMKEWRLENCIGQVLDPTLLLDKNEWKKMLRKDKSSHKWENKKYILIYQIHNDPKLSEYAKRLAKYTNINLVRVNPMLHQFFRGGRFVYCPDLDEFIALIDNASYIVTDSFHGTCFAINFNKQFIEILPNNATSTRNQCLLELTGLSDRILHDFEDFSLANKMIDFRKVDDIIVRERRRSMEIMKTLIS